MLVVDDNLDAVHAITMLIRSFGHAVEFACDGKSALAVAPEFRPDIVFLDIKLPDINGYELARRLRTISTTAHARMYALTGIPGDEFEEISRRENFAGHYLKPMAPAELERLLDE